MARAITLDVVTDLRNAYLQQGEGEAMPLLNYQARLRNKAKEDANFLRELSKVDLTQEIPEIRRLIQRVIREHIPTDLEVLAELVPDSFDRNPKDFIATSIKNDETIDLDLLSTNYTDLIMSADGSRAVLHITDYSTSSRLCLLMSNLKGENGPPNTHIVIQSYERYLHAMYPGGRRANLLFSWINEQPNDSLPEILKSIIAFNRCLLSEREINCELGVNPQTIFLYRVRDDYPICFNAFADMIKPYF